MILIILNLNKNHNYIKTTIHQFVLKRKMNQILHLILKKVNKYLSLIQKHFNILIKY
jgi:hypothetical protein